MGRSTEKVELTRTPFNTVKHFLADQVDLSRSKFSFEPSLSLSEND